MFSVVLFSIIVPVFNTQKYIQKCLESVFLNKNRDFEIIVIDDGSTDNSKEVCKQVKQKYPGFITLINQSNLGVSTARNKGIKEARGKYLIFLDSDDSLMPGALDRIELEENIDWYLFNYNSEDYLADSIQKNQIINIDSKIPFSEKALFPYRNIDGVPNGNYSTPWSKVFKRDIIINNNIKYPEAVKMGEDMLFNLQYLQYCRRIKLQKMKLYQQTLYRFDSAVNHKKSKNEQLENEKQYNTAMKRIWLKYGFNEKAPYLYYDKLIMNFVNDYINYKDSFLDENDVKFAVKQISSNKSVQYQAKLAKFILNSNKYITNFILECIRLIKS